MSIISAEAIADHNRHLRSDVVELRKQLADERAKVALAVEALKPLTAEVAGMIGIEEKAFRDLLGNTNVNCLKRRWLDARSALETLQSSDALAAIRREVARECAEFMRDAEILLPIEDWAGTKKEYGDKLVDALADMVCDKFGVTE